MNPRAAAVETLLMRRRGRVDVDSEAMRRLDSPRRGQAHDLVLGVRRNLFLIDAVLRRFLSKPVKSVPGPALEALRCGVYELVFNDRVPSAVGVSETGNVVGNNPKLRGLLNAVLRKIASGFEIVPHAPARDRHHITAGPGRVVRFERAIFPEPAEDLVKHLSMRHTLTETFVAAFIKELPLEYESLFEACGRRMPVALRPVGSRSLADLRARIESESATWVGDFETVGAVTFAGPLSELPAVRDGIAVVQDRVASEVAPFVAPRAGERILDLCAPPGGKTVHLCELMGGRGEVVASFTGSDRQTRLRENVERLGHTDMVRIHDLGEEGGDLPTGPFDRVLVDAPCSNTGVLMKRVDARFRVQADELSRLESLQDMLLGRAADLVRPGGVLVHSTCSLVAAENHGCVRRFLIDHPDFRIDEERLRYPHRTGRDGGYMARLIRAD